MPSCLLKLLFYAVHVIRPASNALNGLSRVISIVHLMDVLVHLGKGLNTCWCPLREGATYGPSPDPNRQ